MLVTEFMENGDLFRSIAADSTGRFGWYRCRGPNGRLVPHTGLARRIALDVARGLFFLHDKKARAFASRTGVGHPALQPPQFEVTHDLKVAGCAAAALRTANPVPATRVGGTCAC